MGPLLSEVQVGGLVEEPAAALHRERPMLPSPSDGLFGGFDEEDLPPRPLGPGDSHYELTAIDESAPAASGDDWPAVSSAVTAEDWGASEAQVDWGGSEALAVEPGLYKGIVSWGRVQFFAVMGFGALSLAALGFLLVRALTGKPLLDSSHSALVVGLIGIIAFLLLSITTGLLGVLLLDLARNLRRLRDHVDRHGRIVRD
jgi:hypothetical protein